MTERAAMTSPMTAQHAKPVLRVAHIIHGLGPGGAENVLVELAAAADAAALEMVVVGLSPVDNPVHAATLRRIGVPVVELDLARWDPRAVLRTAALLRTHRVQVIHTHLKHADLTGALAARRLGVPWVSTLHVIEDTPHGLLGRFKRSAGLVARTRLAARTIAVSEAQRQWYEELSDAGDVVVLPNGVGDPEPVTAARRERIRTDLQVPPGGALLVSASLMRPEKGHGLLLDAVALLPRTRPVVVALAGDGPLRTALTSRVDADPALRDRVSFLGYRDDVPSLLGAADLVLHTSHADALPTTLINALAVGVPVVATRVGGIPDIITDAVGTLTAPDPIEIAEAVTRLLDDPILRKVMSAAGRERFLERFEARGWARRLRSLYDQVLDGQQ